MTIRDTPPLSSRALARAGWNLGLSIIKFPSARCWCVRGTQNVSRGIGSANGCHNSDAFEFRGFHVSCMLRVSCVSTLRRATFNRVFVHEEVRSRELLMGLKKHWFLPGCVCVRACVCLFLHSSARRVQGVGTAGLCPLRVVRILVGGGYKSKPESACQMCFANHSRRYTTIASVGLLSVDSCCRGKRSSDKNKSHSLPSAGVKHQHEHLTKEQTKTPQHARGTRCFPFCVEERHAAKTRGHMPIAARGVGLFG